MKITLDLPAINGIKTGKKNYFDPFRRRSNQSHKLTPFRHAIALSNNLLWLSRAWHCMMLVNKKGRHVFRHGCRQRETSTRQQVAKPKTIIGHLAISRCRIFFVHNIALAKSYRCFKYRSIKNKTVELAVLAAGVYIGRQIF